MEEILARKINDLSFPDVLRGATFRLIDNCYKEDSRSPSLIITLSKCCVATPGTGWHCLFGTEYRTGDVFANPAKDRGNAVIFGLCNRLYFLL